MNFIHDETLPDVMSRLLADQDLSIFLFHGVTDEHHSDVRNYTGKHIHVDLFHEIIKKLSKVGRALSMDQVLYHLKEKEPFPKNSFSMTFDDGFENNYSIAAPILTDYKVPGIIYIATSFVDENRMSWIDRIEFAVEKTVSNSLTAFWDDTQYKLNNNDEKINFLKHVRSFVKNNPKLNPNEFADRLCEHLGLNITSSDHPLDKKMSWNQVRELNESDYITIGGHSHTHPILSFLDQDDLIEEIQLSINLLKDKAGINTIHYSYPEGLEHCYSEPVIQCLKDFGIKCCPTAITGYNEPHTDPFHLKRFLIA